MQNQNQQSPEKAKEVIRLKKAVKRVLLWANGPRFSLAICDDMTYWLGCQIPNDGSVMWFQVQKNQANEFARALSMKYLGELVRASKCFYIEKDGEMTPQEKAPYQWL